MLDKSKKLLAGSRSLECSWSNRSCGRARVVSSSSSGLHEIRNTSNENGRHDPSRSRDCVLLESVCVCFGKEFAPFAQQLLPYLFQVVAATDILQGEVSQDAELGAGFAGFEDEEENDDTNLKLSVSTGNADKKVSAINCLGAIADYAPCVRCESHCCKGSCESTS